MFSWTTADVFRLQVQCNVWMRVVLSLCLKCPAQIGKAADDYHWEAKFQCQICQCKLETTQLKPLRSFQIYMYQRGGIWSL